MRRFYLAHPNTQPAADLTWSHYKEEDLSQSAVVGQGIGGGVERWLTLTFQPIQRADHGFTGPVQAMEVNLSRFDVLVTE
jgi:hypothetical protein